MKNIVVILFFILCVCFNANAEHNCFPKNNKLNPIGIKTINSITQEEFKESIAKAKEVYSPIFIEQYNADLVIQEKWEDATVNAYASRSGKQWQVAMFGGLARDPAVTKDGFTAVICHEIGHHVAGAPKKASMGIPTWAANEGQSDYFATSKCLKKIFEKENKINLKLFRDEITEDQKLAKQACKKVYNELKDQALCFRISLAGESLAKLLGTLGGTPDVKFGTPDKAIVPKTNHNHPKGQCRMDTYFQGALCNKDHLLWPSNTDVAEGYCTLKEKHEIGNRPLCWYNPEEYE